MTHFLIICIITIKYFTKGLILRVLIGYPLIAMIFDVKRLYNRIVTASVV